MSTTCEHIFEELPDGSKICFECDFKIPATFTAADESAPRCFRIIRFFKVSGRRRVIRNNVSEADAQAHCSRKDTMREGVWFDGYDYMPGCRPKSV